VKEQKHSEARAVWCSRLWAPAGESPAIWTPPRPATLIARAHNAVTSVALLEMLPNQDAPSPYLTSSYQCLSLADSREKATENGM